MFLSIVSVCMYCLCEILKEIIVCGLVGKLILKMKKIFDEV